MSKIIKQMELDALAARFKGVRDMVLLSTNKIDAALDYNFRKTLREKGIKVMVVKNTLANKVFTDQGVRLEGVWSGTTLIAWGPESIKDLSKTVDAAIKDAEKSPKNKEKYKIKTAVADGQPIPMAVAMKMPTRLEAIGEIMGMILGPASEIVAALTGPGGQVASQIATIADKKEEEGAKG